MGVEFLDLGAVQIPSSTDGALTISGDARAAVIAVGQSEVDGMLLVAGEAELDVIAEVIEPDIPTTVDGTVYLSTEAVMSSGTGVFVDSGVTISGEAAPAGTTEGVLYYDGEANSAFEFTGYYGFAAEEPEIGTCYVGMSFEAVNDKIQLGDEQTPLLILVLQEIAALSSARTGRYQGEATLQDLMSLREHLQTTIRMALAEGVSLDDAPDASFTAVCRVLNRLLLSGVVRHEAEAARLLSDALTLMLALDALPTIDVTESVALADLVAGLHTAVGQALERVLLSGAVIGSHQLTLLVREAVALNAAAMTEVELVAALREAVGVAMTLSFDDGLYTAWVLNTEGLGLSTYSNYPFNSFAKIGSRYYGLHTGGIVRLGGETDDGAPIAARLRMGMFDFNDRNLKAFSEVYVGASGGQLLLKAIWVDDASGEKRAILYRMKARPAHDVRETRFEAAKGLKAVDWDFELENVDGAMFDLQTIQFQPMALSRRTRG